MENHFYEKYLNNAKLFFVISFIINIALSVWRYFMAERVSVLNSLSSTVVAIILSVVIALLFKSSVKDLSKNEKTRLLPLAFLPYTVYIILQTITIPISNIVKLFDLDVRLQQCINTAVFAVLSFVLCMTLGVAVIKKYLSLYDEFRIYTVPSQYRLSQKWVYIILSGFGSGIIAAAIVFLFSMFTSSELDDISSPVFSICNIVIYLLFFNAFFKNIEKRYRRVFLPTIGVSLSISALFGHLIQPVTFVLMNDILTDGFKPDGFIIRTMIMLVLSLFISILALVTICKIVKKSLEAFEKTE